ncbi:hypothetical protein ABZ348_33085 [Streptomyces sp. NPDC005963]|uniref:HAAS signaling domain-containing protein n=1 Tax=Streptomyces sp. NPDC005963 TaxID=3156721 RepID=UPI0033F94A2C
MTLKRDQLVEDYLQRLDNAAVFLPADRREELKQEIVEHIDVGLEEADARHVEAVRAVLERLGPPADIVAAELSDPRSTDSTGSTPVVTPTVSAGDVAAKVPAKPEAPPQQVVVGKPRGPLASSRGMTILLAGAAGVVLVMGTLFVGLSSEGGGPPEQSPAQVEPEVTPSQGGGPGSTWPSAWPSDGSEPGAPPSEVLSAAPVAPTASS